MKEKHETMDVAHHYLCLTVNTMDLVAKTRPEAVALQLLTNVCPAVVYFRLKVADLAVHVKHQIA